MKFKTKNILRIRRKNTLSKRKYFRPAIKKTERLILDQPIDRNEA